MAIETLPDGVYKTYATFGPRGSVRLVEVKNGCVTVLQGGVIPPTGRKYSVADFFSVNTLVRKLSNG